MIYKQLVQNKIGHRYYQFVEQKNKVSEPADVPAKKRCWCGETLMKFTSLSNHMIYLNVSQHQICTTSKLKKLYKKWINDVQSNKISLDTFKKLFKTHYESLTEIPKYSIINNKKHSTQCSYAIECFCQCWCEGKYHGKMIIRGITP